MSSVRLPRVIRTASFRLAFLYALLFGGSVAILGLVGYWAIEAALERHIATRIDAELAFFESKFRSEGLAELVEEVHERIESSVDGGHLEYLVVDAQGQRLVGNLPSMPAESGSSKIAYPGDARNPEDRWIHLRVIELNDGTRLAVGDSLGLLREINKAILDGLGWILIAFLALSLAGGLLLSLGFLRRVDEITRTAEAIIAGDLGRRIPLRGTKDDFDRLSGSLNQMLDRIVDLMESLRQVSNDIAHDLRTPLARLRHKLETLRRGVPSGADQSAVVAAAIAEADAILETFAALLRIAQVEAGTRRTGFREFDVSGVFGTVADAFGAAAEAEGKVLTADIEPGLTILGDRELLTQMLANLVENAIRHTPEGSRIEMELAGTGSGLTAVVSDNGPGVPAQERERIFRRFYRLERSRTTPGSGLGLALVAAIADLHGIELTAADNAPGLKIMMKFVTPQGASA
jgi:signal transduction histidine kinase